MVALVVMCIGVVMLVREGCSAVVDSPCNTTHHTTLHNTYCAQHTTCHIAYTAYTAQVIYMLTRNTSQQLLTQCFCRSWVMRSIRRSSLGAETSCRQEASAPYAIYCSSWPQTKAHKLSMLSNSLSDPWLRYDGWLVVDGGGRWWCSVWRWVVAGAC